MKRLIAWRHGVTIWNASGRFQGHEDVDLTDTGREQAASAATKLAALGPTRIVSSDLRRASETAGALAAVTGLDVRIDQRLRERCFGPWQGLRGGEIVERWPAEFRRWQLGESSVGLGIEAHDDLRKRVAQAAEDYAEEDELVVLATHGGTAKALCQALLGWPPEVARTLKVLGNCHWTELRKDPARGWLLWAHNVG